MAGWLRAFCIAAFPAGVPTDVVAATATALANARYVPHELWYEVHLHRVHGLGRPPSISLDEKLPLPLGAL